MTEQIIEHPLVYDIARKTMQIVPFVMRFMTAEMRGGEDRLQSGHMAIMGMLQYRPHMLSELAQRLSVGLATMSSTVTTLESRGWVARERSQDDRRIVWVRLTDLGEVVLEEGQREVAQRIAAVFSSMSAEEQQRLESGLNTLADAFETYMRRAADPADTS